MFRKVLVLVASFCLLFEQSGFAQVAGQMPVPGYLSNLLPRETFSPVHLRSVVYEPTQDAFRLMLDKGDEKLQKAQFNAKAGELWNYFLIGLRLPNDTFWVNLRPDSPNDVIDSALEKTELGRIMLAADVQLKKDIAKLTSPDTSEGKNYWNKVYDKALQVYGQVEMEIPALTRPWIVPGEVIIKETAEGAYIYKASLNVMLEQDHIKNSPFFNFSDPKQKALNEYSSELIRTTILPKLIREVNSSKRYAQLRQVYYSLVLAQWFKQRMQKESANIAKVDSKDLSGLTSPKAWSKDTYYKQYAKSFNRGEYKKEETVSTPSGLVVRSYFSGGLQLVRTDMMGIPGAKTSPILNGGNVVIMTADNAGNVMESDNLLTAVRDEMAQQTDGGLNRKDNLDGGLRQMDVQVRRAAAIANAVRSKRELAWQTDGEFNEKSLEVLKSFLQNRAFAERMAAWLDSAYYRGQGKPAPEFLSEEERTATIEKSLAGEKIAMNLAGFYALECGLGVLAEATGLQFADLLAKVADGSLPEEFMLVLARFANATWKAGQPFRELERIERPVFVPASMLDDKELEKDFVQIREAAVLLQKQMGEDAEFADAVSHEIDGLSETLQSFMMRPFAPVSERLEENREALTVLKRLLQSRAFAEEMAVWLDGAYYRGQGKPAPQFLTEEEKMATIKKSASEEKIAINLAGFYALECGLGIISALTRENFMSLLKKARDGDLPQGYMHILGRFANATWKAGQPFRDLGRIERDIFIPALMIEEEKGRAEIEKDIAQIREAAHFLFEEMYKDSFLANAIIMEAHRQSIVLEYIRLTGKEYSDIEDNFDKRLEDKLQIAIYNEWLESPKFRASGGNMYYSLINWDDIAFELALEDENSVSNRVSPDSGRAAALDGGRIMNLAQDMSAAEKQELLDKLYSAKTRKIPVTIVTQNKRIWTGILPAYYENELARDIDQGKLKLMVDKKPFTFYWGEAPRHRDVIVRSVETISVNNLPNQEYQEIIYNEGPYDGMVSENRVLGAETIRVEGLIVNSLDGGSEVIVETINDKYGYGVKSWKLVIDGRKVCDITIPQVGNPLPAARKIAQFAQEFNEINDSQKRLSNDQKAIFLTENAISIISAFAHNEIYDQQKDAEYIRKAIQEGIDTFLADQTAAEKNVDEIAPREPEAPQKKVYTRERPREQRWLAEPGEGIVAQGQKPISVRYESRGLRFEEEYFLFDLMLGEFYREGISIINIDKGGPYFGKRAGLVHSWVDYINENLEGYTYREALTILEKINDTVFNRLFQEPYMDERANGLPSVMEALRKELPQKGTQKSDAEMDGGTGEFIELQVGKLDVNDVEWSKKVPATEENRKKAGDSIDEIRGVLSELLSLVEADDSLRSREKDIQRAIELVFDRQGESLRADAKLYPVHPLGVALKFVRDMGITDPDLIISAILHDIIEDVFFDNPGFIGETFGRTVQENVQSVSNKPMSPGQKESVRKIVADALKLDLNTPEIVEALTAVLAVVEYQVGVIREITSRFNTLLLKSADFSDNALTQKNLASDVKLQSRLSSKYRDLLLVFAEEFESAADAEDAKTEGRNEKLGIWLRNNSQAYRDGYEEVKGYSSNWAFADLHGQALGVIQSEFNGLRGLAASALSEDEGLSQQTRDGGVEKNLSRAGYEDIVQRIQAIADFNTLIIDPAMSQGALYDMIDLMRSDMLSVSEFTLITEIGLAQLEKYGIRMIKKADPTNIQNRGGIDFRTVPFLTAPGTGSAMPAFDMKQLQLLASQSKMQDLDKEWGDIKQQMAGKQMPYAKMKEYVAVCRTKAATKHMENITSCVSKVLRLEEQCAVKTAPEMKELLVVIEAVQAAG